MNPRPPTEEEKAELVEQGVGISYIVDKMGGSASQEATSDEAIRDLIEHAAIAVFDDYTYEEEEDGERSTYKKLIIIVFSNDPFHPQIWMLGSDGITREGLVEFDVVGEHYLSDEEFEADFEAEEEYQLSLTNPAEENEEASKQPSLDDLFLDYPDGL